MAAGCCDLGDVVVNRRVRRRDASRRDWRRGCRIAEPRGIGLVRPLEDETLPRVRRARRERLIQRRFAATVIERHDPASTRSSQDDPSGNRSDGAVASGDNMDFPRQENSNHGGEELEKNLPSKERETQMT